MTTDNLTRTPDLQPGDVIPYTHDIVDMLTRCPVPVGPAVYALEISRTFHTGRTVSVTRYAGSDVMWRVTR